MVIALALAATADPRAIDVLLTGLDDETPQVKTYCVTALGMMTGEAYGQDKERWSAWWSEQRGSFQPRILEHTATAPLPVE